MNWSAYDTDIRESFRKLREEQKLFDVTLVTDDGQHIQAHKVILSAGSHFFSSIFMKSNHSNMLVYLKGISSDKLVPVIDFIYNGEAFMKQEELKMFIETGKELLVKGLEDELTEVMENRNEDATFSEESDQKYNSSMHKKEFAGSTDDKCDTEDKIDEESLKLKVNNEIDLQITEMVERNEGDVKYVGKQHP